jgi:ionotropic glutamate receptor
MVWNKSLMLEKPSNAKMLDTQDENIKIYGYVPDLIDHLEEKMHFKAKIDLVPLNITYNSIIESVQNKNWDVAMSDITITANRIVKVDFSLPIFEDTIRIVIRESPSFDVKFFSYLLPFSSYVWLAIVGLILFSGLLVYIFERQEKEQQQKRYQAVIIGVYRATNSIVGIGGDFQLRTTSSRIMTVALFTLGCVLGAMYTANLASFLTLRRTNPPISGIDDIKNGRLPFRRVGVVKNTSIVDYYIKNVADVYYPLENSQDIYLALLEDRIDAALFDASVLEYAVDQNYCGRLSVVGVGFGKSSFGIAMKKDWEYKADFDMNILSLRERDLIEKKWFLKRSCNTETDNMWEYDGIPMSSVSGLFLTFLMVSGIALALHLWHSRVKIGKCLKPQPTPALNEHEQN